MTDKPRNKPGPKPSGKTKKISVSIAIDPELHAKVIAWKADELSFSELVSILLQREMETGMAD